MAVATQKRVAIYGTGDAAELVYLLLKDMGLELVAVFDAAGEGTFLGLPIRPVAEQASVDYDVLVIAALERPAGTAKLLRQLGVPDSKIVTLRPGAPPAAVAAEAGAAL